MLLQPELHQKLEELEKKHLTPSDEHFTPLVNIAREPNVTSKDEYTTALYFTTEQYVYYVHVDQGQLALKKFKVDDNSPSAKARSNKQFRDKPVYNDCGTCKPGGTKAKEEVDSSGAIIKKVNTKLAEVDSPSADSADGSILSNSRSSSSQLSSPEGPSTSSPNSKVLLDGEKNVSRNDSETLDSGVEAN